MVNKHMNVKFLKAILRGLTIMLLFSICCLPLTAYAYDWSMGWEWWAQGAWTPGTDEYNYGCMVVAHAKLLVYAGIASDNPDVFNPQVLLEWERATGHIDSLFYNTNTEYTPIHYAQALGKELYSGGITYGNDACRAKIWENISNGYYSVLWIDSGTRTGHWVLVNNGGSQVMGQIRYYESGYSTTSATVNLGSATVNRVYTYYVPSIPATAELDVNGWTDNTENGGVVNYATFDVYINGAKVADDVSDFCQVYDIGTSYAISDIKVASGKAFDGFSSYTRSGYTSGVRTGTLNSNTDVRLTLHTVDAAAFVQNHTPSAVSVYKEHSYYFYDVPVTWYDAKIVSEHLGGHLVTITTSAENQFVKSMIGDSACWIGLTDKDSEGTWKWVTGESFSYSNWYGSASGGTEPNNDAASLEGQENYVHIRAGASNWNDNSSCFLYSFICEIDRAYTITYNSNGGTGIAPQKKAVGQSIALSTVVPTRAGYAFQGWQATVNGQTVNYAPGAAYSADANITLNAEWQSLKYTITYDPNGGTGAPAAQTINGGAATLSSVTPTRRHHSFLGWAPDNSAATAVYQPGDTYSDGVDVTLYAVWQRNLDNVMILPKMLTEIEPLAFIGTAADAFVVPDGVTFIGAHAFDDVAIYGYAGSYAEIYANENGLVFIPIDDQWVPEDAVPKGAHVTDEKWTYILKTTETTTSTVPSLPGWVQAGYEWQESGSGTWKYANFPGGFDTGSSLYTKYNKSALTNSTTETTKRVVSGSSHLTYIYWHWTFVDYVEDTYRNVVIEDARKLGVNISGSVYRDFIYFDAFETTTSLSQEGMSTGGLTTYDGLWSTYHHPEYNLPEYASWWWYQFDVKQQSYTDYQKLFTYVKEHGEMLESFDEVIPGGNITNVQHWVKYSF